MNKQKIIVRNPFSIRPYQHVLEPLYAYLLIAAKQYEDGSYAGWYNVGPDESDCYQTGDLVDCFIKYWGSDASWEQQGDGGPHEANFLKLDCAKLKARFGWRPRWNLEKAIEKTVEWTKIWLAGNDVLECMDKQIFEFFDH